MFTWGPKYLFGVSISALVGAAVYGLVTGGELLGVLTLGYKGGMGEHLGYVMLIAAFVSSQVLAWVLVASRDGDAEALAHRAGATSVPPVQNPADASYWGVITAFGVAAVVVGLALSMLFFYLGLAVLFVAALMWLLLAWSDRASGDVEVNRVVRARVAAPFEVPMLSLLGFAVVSIGMSRVFLAASQSGAVVAGVIATAIIFGGAVILSQVEVRPAIMRGVVVLAAIAVLASGIVGAAIGERDFHEEEEHGDIVEGEGE
jgi:hypothetical protein